MDSGKTREVFVELQLQRILRLIASVSLIFFLFCADNAAANSTTAGTVSVAAEEKSLIVTAPYSGDDNFDNTLKIEWDLQGGLWSGGGYGAVTLPHAPGPYVHTITSLTNFTAYQVRVTYLDADGVSGSAVQTITDLKPYNPRNHSSLSTGSLYWSGQWGIPGGKYGEFTCNTCHARETGNIKRIKKDLTSGTADLFPIQQAGLQVVFQDTRDGTAQFGDDGRVDKTVSTNVCEACHSATSVHRFNSSSGVVDFNHQNANKKDCISCHQHSKGFDASCTACHGNDAAGTFWPDSDPANLYPDRIGSHNTHVNKLGNYLASGDKDNATATTTAHKNATCIFCHPDPGGVNVNGGPHSTDTSGSDAVSADVHQDGFNPGTNFKYLDGTTDDGFYNTTIKRCSNIDCHSNGQFTWPWYGDIIPPAAIDDLVAGGGDDPGTVKLTWTAPGNDGDTAGKAYRYEVRYSASPISDDTAWAAAAIAGGPPTTKWPGVAQTMAVAGLQPGATYYFAIKTGDEAGNWSALSAPNPVAVAAPDVRAPLFRGLETALPAYTSGAVNLRWPAAQDDSEPVTYLIWWAPTSSVINYGAAPSAVTSGLSFQATGLTNGTNYNFAVRARDAHGNVDGNTVRKEAIPQMPSENTWLGTVYYAGLVGGATCNSRYTYPGTTVKGALATGNYSPLCQIDDRNEIQSINDAPEDIIQWTRGSAYAKSVNIQGGSFTLYLRENDDRTQTVSVRLGYADDANGTNFVQLGTESKSLKPDYRGMIRFSLAHIAGKIPAGKYLSFIFRKEDQNGFEIRVRYGSQRYNSLLTIYEQVDNLRPNPFSVTAPAASSTQAGAVTVSWDAASDPDGDPVTYDVYGSIDGGTSYPFIIAENLSVTGTAWDTLKAGIGLSAAVTNARIKVAASDGKSHNEGGIWYDQREALSGIFTINNTSDTVAPATITDLVAEPRPKAGSVYLYWSAPGDDGLLGRADQYDIRYSTSLIDAGNFASATAVTGEPVPGDPGHRQGYEVLGLTPGTSYWFAIKTADEAPNWSAISNVVSSTGGPRCGVCHSTPPDEAGRAGTHEEHGFTQVDCAKCHGQEAINFGNDHSDGSNKLAFNNPKKGFANIAYPPVTELADRVTYHAGGTGAGAVIYDDTTGGGGFNDIEPGGDNVDNGSCFNFNTTGVTGCHGAAGTDPDGAGPLPTYPAPKWGDVNSVSCAMCHGDQSRPDATPYGRPYEDPQHDTKYAGNVEIYKAAPGIDLLGNTDSNAVGQHLRHLNFSYRFTGNSCALCHLGSEHADGTVDVVLDPSVAGEGATWTPAAGGPGTPGTCGGTSELRCHGANAVDPPWRTRAPEPSGPRVVECSECHGMSGKLYDVAGNSSAIPHVKDGGQVRHCTWCHVEGHPREGYAISGISKANPAQVASARHNISTGDTVVLHVEGMSELDRWFGTITLVDSDRFTLDGVDSTGYGTFTAGYWRRAYPAKSITAISNASPAVVTSAGHGLATGANVLLSAQGMTQLNKYDGPVTVIDADRFSLDGVDSTSYGAFTSGRWIKTDGTILVPNYSISGIDYSSGGIHLKRVVNGRITMNNGTLVDSEAETCWACHEDNGISEWGTNTKPLTGNSPFNYGTLNQTNWIGATWTSANFAYKTGAIQSTHSVNPEVLGPGVDADKQLRCSYCHDVHDLNKQINDTVSGAPYLRGTWLGNPYQEDGAPGRNPGSYSTSYYNELDFGRVPRGTPAQQKMGGYWIDQNSNYPTASWTLQGSAGLCTMCHGTDVNNMNKFGDPAADWVGPNGHSNAVIGGSGMNKINLYNPAKRNEGVNNGTGANSYWPNMAYLDTTGTVDGSNPDRMYGLRNSRGGNGISPYAYNADTAKYEYAYGEFNWGMDMGTTDAEPSYHRFSCSKCHNPHASRLPRLMITNCLDVRHNKWDNLFTGDSDWAGGPVWRDRGVMPYNGTDVSGARVDQQLAYATSAQNCHRYVNINNDSTPEEAGWNKVTPWNETSTWFSNN